MGEKNLYLILLDTRIRILTFREVFVLNILELSVCINLFNYLS